jgi:hypothetical protein
LRKIALVILLALLSACTAAPGARPNKFNYPITYLQNYKLGQTEDEAVSLLGSPDNSIDVAGKRRLVYYPWNHNKISYSYVVDNGIIVDVIYNESGSLNGQTAKKLQADKK